MINKGGENITDKDNNDYVDDTECENDNDISEDNTNTEKIEQNSVDKISINCLRLFLFYIFGHMPHFFYNNYSIRLIRADLRYLEERKIFK